MLAPARKAVLPLAVPLALAVGCRSGERVAPAPPGAYLLVLSKEDATIAVVQTTTGWTRDTAPTGTGPHEVAAADDGSIAVVSNYGGQEPGHTLSVYGFRERRVVDTIDLSPHTRPHGIAFLDHRTTVLVTSETSHAVLEVDVPGRRVVRTFDTGADGSHMLALSRDGKRLYTANVGSGSVSAIDLRTGGLLKTAKTGSGTEAIALSPDGKELWVGNRGEDDLCVLDAGSLDEIARIPSPKFPIRLAFTPDGTIVLATCAASDEVRVFDARGRKEIRTIAIPGTVGPSTPVGLLVEPGGDYAFVACAAAKKVAVLDLATWSLKSAISTGAGPDGMAWASGFGTIRR
jgi:YVTN family beta-propeller protein